MIPAGKHRAKALSAVLSQASTGNEQIAVEFELLDLDAQRITWFGYFTDATIEHTLKGLRAAGWQGLDIADMSSLLESPNEVSLVVEHERNEKDGSLRAKVRWVNAWGGPALQPLAQDKMKALSARIRAEAAKLDRAQAAPKNNGAPKPAPKSRTGGVLPPEPPPHTDDSDLPF